MTQGMFSIFCFCTRCHCTLHPRASIPTGPNREWRLHFPFFCGSHLEPENSNGTCCRHDANLGQEEHKVTHTVNGCHTQDVVSDDAEGLQQRTHSHGNRVGIFFTKAEWHQKSGFRFKVLSLQSKWHFTLSKPPSMAGSSQRDSMLYASPHTWLDPVKGALCKPPHMAGSSQRGIMLYASPHTWLDPVC